MKEIKCPNCNTVFSIDDSKYLEILEQVKKDEFSKELEEKLHSLMAQKNSEFETEKQKLLNEKYKENSELLRKVSVLEEQIENTKASLNAEKENELLKKQNEINVLHSKLEEESKRVGFEIEKALVEKDKEISQLKQNIEIVKKNAVVNEQNLKEKFQMKLDQQDAKLKEKDAEIAYFKDFKTKLSTKMVGESLEQYCLNEFNKIRMTAFPNAYFEKDNEIIEGTKGDFVYKEKTEEGIEMLSIMFEMKNESDATSAKHKNEDFFEKLDKDRKKKGCEYAVLVSMLESDNEFYNSGIVDVSYKFEKMYVVRPQCFISIIGLLRNAAKANYAAKKELATYRQQNLDISNFEIEFNEFKNSFEKNYQHAKDNFDDAISKIDSTIKYLNGVKESLLKTTKQLSAANNKAQDMTIKKLTKNSPSLYEEYKKNKK